MKVEFTQEADYELTEASLWYESKESGLGIRLQTIVVIAVAHSHRKPDYWVDR